MFIRKIILGFALILLLIQACSTQTSMNRPPTINAASYPPSRLAISIVKETEPIIGETSQIYVINADGGGFKQLTHTPKADNFWPNWSPDGKQIAFESNRDGSFQIYTMTADGSRQKRLTQFEYSAYPNWLPDGKRLVFLKSDTSGNDDIYIMNSDGSNVRRLTQNKNTYQVPFVSPNGEKVAVCAYDRFIGFRGAIQYLYIINVDGSNQVRIDKPSYHCDISWSPSSKKLTFSRINSQQSADEKPVVSIVTVDADGKNLTELAKGNDIPLYPNWSDDEQQIYFTAPDHDKMRLFQINADGSDKRAAFANNSEISKFSLELYAWSPGMRNIAFVSTSPSPGAENSKEFKIFDVSKQETVNLNRLLGYRIADAQFSWQPTGPLKYRQRSSYIFPFRVRT
jgi:Tol biopolymer transport system component